MSKITFGKSEPWHSGWRGWADSVDVMKDGVKIGTLDASGESNRKHLTYHWFGSELLDGYPNMIGVLGLAAAKARVRELLGT